ncbi:MAG TPA: FAD-dependent oxidoreductase, partial [Myxococcota bacterium]|nr:FAD-dependent oxidoreductase [Myxococcota bacterium]
VESLLKENGKVVGAMVRDKETNQVWPVLAKVVINATGIFADAVRKMDDENATNIMTPSQGSHVLLPEKYCSKEDGLIIPKTKDGRVLFLLPWLGKALAGTTDHPEKITALPRASDEEVEYILEHLRHYLGVPISRPEVIATWSGLRPLVKPKEAPTNTASISRDHLIDVSLSKLVTIVGGKWTTYRKMGEDVIDVAISVGKLSPLNGSLTKDLKLLGGRHYKSNLAHEVAAFEKLPFDIALHLAKSYGDRVDAVIDVDNKSKRERLIDGFPYIEAEVIYGITHEHALHSTDVIGRRMRLAFLDNRAARLALPKVVSLMAKQLKWDKNRMHEEMDLGTQFLDTMMTKPPITTKPSSEP